MLKIVNKVRAEGVTCKGKYYPPVALLIWNNELEETVQIHSDDMFKNDFLSHQGSDDSWVLERILRTNTNSGTIGENVAERQRSEQETLDDWLQSPSHWSNIMDTRFTKMGVALKGNYWAQVFAR